jgi:hypothetical protein
MLQRQATKTIVRVNGAVREELHPVSLDLSTGGSRLDSVVLEFVKGREIDIEGEALVDFEHAECEVSVELFNDGAATGEMQVVHWGMIAAQSVVIDPSGPRRGFISRLEHFHFGSPLRGMRVRATPRSVDEDDRSTDEEDQPPKTILVREAVVFNPDYQGRCVGNMSKAGSIRQTVFVPPEQLRISSLGGAVSGAENNLNLEPRTADGLEVGFWTLSKAVQMLCDLCNGDQARVKNPNARDLDALFGRDETELRNHVQPLGKYLPQQLDHLLRPYGFDWNVDYAGGVRQIRVFARGRGTPGQIKLQGAGEQLDMRKSNAESVDLSADVSSRCLNEITVLGDHEQVEATFELVPAWSKDKDTADIDDLMPSSEKWTKSDGVSTSRVWRDWVLNEAGDYNGERDGIRRAYDLAPIIGPCAAKRRKFEPTITTDTDGTPFGPQGGVTIEWWDLEGGDDGTGSWRPLSDISAEGRAVKILAHECGIRFDGDVPPSEIMDQGINSDTEMPKAKIRVTASIRADRRVEATQSFPAPLDPEVNSETVDVGSRFKKRTIRASSIYYPKVVDGQMTSTQLDDTAAAKDLALQLLANWCQASVSGTLTLTGCGYRPTAALGRPISGITGRNVDFRTTADFGEKKYPVVVGLRYDFTNQTLGVTLDTFRGEVL